MEEKFTTSGMALRLWFFTWVTLSAGFFIVSLFSVWQSSLIVFFLTAACSCVGSIPAFIVLLIFMGRIRDVHSSLLNKFLLVLLLQLIISSLYGLALWGFNFSPGMLDKFLMATTALFACNLLSTALNYNRFIDYFHSVLIAAPRIEEPGEPFTIHQNKNNIIMQNDSLVQNELLQQPTASSNKVLIKAAITGGLILLMLIPTVFIMNMVQEREQLQRQVVAEVSNKWAQAQTITGPYIVVPYNETYLGKDNKIEVTRNNVVLLPEELQVAGKLSPEERKRSIYTVLLYRSKLQASGKFIVKIPADIKQENLVLNEAKLCLGITDFKGIEEKVTINFNGVAYDLTPGLPTNEIDTTGLSCTLPLTRENLLQPLPFNLNLKIKGSGQLSFVPLSGNSAFSLNSKWPNPSFDGSSLPAERQVSSGGFQAKWLFNKANLPFNTFLKDFKLNKASYVFGVSMVQPAGHYAKTMRSVKYAILLIGLTFSLFFIVELMQKRPVHPVQYVLVGLALVIFYTLLLSISEFVLFDKAYLIAAGATVLLITLYARGHFASFKTASVFALVLSSLYGFIFVLIRLEDTALLVGSIGLFMVLALVMYASRRINWYNPTFNKTMVAAE